LPRFDRLWTDCIQEEAQLESRNGKQKRNNDENQALVPVLGRVEEEVLQRERHLQSLGGRRTLARSSALLVMIMVTMLHSVHTIREREGSNRHQQQRLMRLQTDFRGSSY
jgi:hypothetical protein